MSTPSNIHEDPRQSGEMPFLEHLAELRSVLLTSAAACGIAAVAGWWLAPWVMEDVIRRTVGQAVVLSPLEAFNERIKLALLIGLIIATPIVFYRLWSFIVPGLLKKERSLILPMALGSMLMFVLGVLGAYLYLLPLIVTVMNQFMTPSMRPEIRLTMLLGLLYNLSLACGLVFQLPLVTTALTAIGLVTPKALVRHWRYAIVAVFLLTAIITPGDVVTAQVIMGIPMVGLYVVSIGLSWLVVRRRKKAEAEREAEEEEASDE
jgi:sec-independent protein translocase protein TatC